MERQDERFAAEHDAGLLLLVAFLMALPVHVVASWRSRRVSKGGAPSARSRGPRAQGVAPVGGVNQPARAHLPAGTQAVGTS